MAVRIGLLDDVALGIAAVAPARLAALHGADEAVAVLEAGGLFLRRHQGHQVAGLVVVVLGHGSKGVALGHQLPLRVVGFLVYRAVGIDLAYQACVAVVDEDLAAAIALEQGRGTRFVVPFELEVQGLDARPLTHAASLLAGALPGPVEAGAAGQVAFEDHMLFVVAVALDFAKRIVRLLQLACGVVDVAGQCLHAAPGGLLGVRRDLLLIFHGLDAALLIAERQGPTGAVAQATDAAGEVAANVKAVAVGIADGDQVAALAIVAEVVEARLVARLGQDEFGRVGADEDGGLR